MADDNGAANNAEVGQEVIDISSDDEIQISSDEEKEVEEVQVVDEHHFEQKVTAAMARFDREQVMVRFLYRIIKNFDFYIFILHIQTFTYILRGKYNSL